MGRIDRIEVCNFKSYVGKQTIGPFTEFTAVIGPNGSGKSNLMDAICFVLGLDAKSLRGERNSDLIWSPSAGDRSAARAAKSAYVSLVYVSSRRRSSGKGKAGAGAGGAGGAGDDASDEHEAEEVESVFTRRITASGSSHYSVDGGDVSYEEYKASLEAIHVYTDARNFLVFQGDVQSVASKSPPEMLGHFEAFSGAEEFRPAHEEAARELHDAALELKSKGTKRRNTAVERKLMAEQAAEAERFTAKRAERDGLKLQGVLFGLYAMERRIKGEEDAAAEAIVGLREAEAAEAALSERLSGMAKTLSRLQKDAAAKEKAASAADRAAGKATSDADGVAAGIAAAAKRAEELAAAVKRLSGDRDKRAADVATLEGEVAEVEAALARIDTGEDADAADGDAAGAGAGAGAGKSSKSGKASSKSAKDKEKKKGKGKGMDEDDEDEEADGGAGAGAGASSGRRAAAGGPQGTASLTPAKRAEYHALKARERAATADLRARIDRLMRERGEAEAVVAKHRGAITTMEAAKVELTRTAEANATRKAELEAGLKAHGAKRREKEGELDSLRRSLAADEERMTGLARELFAVKEALGSFTDRARRSEAEKREAAAVEDLKRLFPGVRGRLVDLVNPTSKAVKLAVTVALGKHLDAVVVNAQATAFECIKHLREAEVRPMTFIPLDAIVPSEPDDELLAQVAAAARSGGGGGGGAGAGAGGGGGGGGGGGASSYRFVRDVLQFDPDLERAVSYAAGSTVIADSLADAKRLRFGAGVRVKVVTLDGSVIAKNGNMTGGVAKGEDGFGGGGGGGAGSRSAVWDEREQRSALARRDALLREEALLQRRLSKGRSAGVGDAGAGAGGGAGGGGARLGWAAQIEDVETALATLGNMVEVVTKDAKSAAARVLECRAELEAIGKRLAAVTPEYEAAAAAIAAADEAIAGVRAEVDAAAEAVFAPFAASLGLASIAAFESAVMAKEEAQQKARGALAERAAKLRSKRDFELARRDDAVRQLGEAQARLAAVEKEVAALRGKEAEARAAAAGAVDAARAAKGDVEAAQAALKKEEGVRAGSGRELRLASDRKAAAAKAVASLQASLALLQSQRHEMLTRAQMEEVRLPVKTGPASAVKPKAKGKGVPKSAGGKGKGKKKGMDEDAEEDEEESDASDSDASDDEDEDEEAGSAGAGAGSSGTPARVFSEAVPATGSAGGSSGETPAAAAARKAAADERRAARVDYSLLEEEYREAAESGSPPAEEVTAKLEQRVHALSAEMARMSPNLKAGALLEEVDARLKAESEEYEAVRKRAAEAQKRLTEAKASRTTRLLAAYRGAAAAIDTIYKDLTRSGLHPTGGSASLSLDDEDQPFESDGGGIRFAVMPPGKQFRDMAALSGGEKTQAALALIFALHAARPSPFLVMDEIDAALDATNVHRVAAYVRARALGRLARTGVPRRMSSSSSGSAGAGGARSRSSSGSAAAAVGDDEVDALAAGVQAIVISLKPAFFDKASSLVGVYQDAAAQGSGILTLDLEPYPAAAPAAAAAAGAAAGGAGAAGAGSVAGSTGSASRAPSAASSADRSVAAGGRR